MGTSLSKAANDVGSGIANVLAAPFKSLFGRSCEDVCEGIWDAVCFIEHICIPDLVKLLLMCGLCYICLVFLYLLYKLGLCQCVVKSLCKMCWAACETYWITLDYICCFCWHKIRYTKRVYRGHHLNHHGHHRRKSSRDVELGYASTSTNGNPSLDHIGNTIHDDHNPSFLIRKRKSWRGRRRKINGCNSSVRLKRGQVWVPVKGKSRRRRKQVKHVRLSSLARDPRNRTTKYKRPRLT